MLARYITLNANQAAWDAILRKMHHAAKIDTYL